MTLLFAGAAGEVTGSCHILSKGDGFLFLDCGMFQGGDERHHRNRQGFPVPADRVRAVVLSHAHLDHCGRLPLLVRHGFSGRIFATGPTCQLARIVLHDSAKLNEEDANWKIKRLKKKGEDWSWVSPLFTGDDVDKLEPLWEPIPYGEWVATNGSVRFRLLDAGHLLGSAMVEVRWQENGRDRSLLFTGDIGPHGMPILRDPVNVASADVLLLECTYGDRNHEPKEGYEQRFGEVISQTLRDGGVVLIPSFAVGRTQEVLYVLGQLMRTGLLPKTDVFVDSPMAEEVAEVYRRHLSLYDEEAKALVRAGRDPLSFPTLRYVKTVEESKELNDRSGPFIVIAGSGMCTGGRIKHHLAHRISDPRTTIIFVGFQAKGTLGRQIVEGASQVRIFGDLHLVRAQVVMMDAFSAHADQSELVRWAEGFHRPPTVTFLVHGEPESATGLKTILSGKGWNCWVPQSGQSVRLSATDFR